jgi:hypothetical protein
MDDLVLEVGFHRSWRFVKQGSQASAVGILRNLALFSEIRENFVEGCCSFEGHELRDCFSTRKCYWVFV